MWVYIQTHAQVSDCNKGVKSTSTTVYWKNAVLKRLFDVCLLLEFLHWYLFSVLLSAQFNICDCALLFDLAKIINSTINKAINVFCPLLCVGGTMYNDQKGVGSGLSKTTKKKLPPNTIKLHRKEMFSKNKLVCGDYHPAPFHRIMHARFACLAAFVSLFCLWKYWRLTLWHTKWDLKVKTRIV